MFSDINTEKEIGMISGEIDVKFQSSHECLFSNSLGQKYCVNNNSHISDIKAEMLQTYQDLYFTINLMLSIL